MLHIGLTRQEIDRVAGIIEKLDQMPPSPEVRGGRDRRIRPRIDFSHAMWLALPLEPGRPWVRIYSRNLSTGGMAFIARAPYALGSYVVISHHLNEECDQLALSCVRLCRLVDEGLYEIGVEFQTLSPDPRGQRRIPPGWLSQVLRYLWVARAMPDGELRPHQL